MEFGPVLENVASVFALLITLSVIIERGLATVFGWKYYQKLLGGRDLRFLSRLVFHF